jgi:hypothetical protein
MDLPALVQIAEASAGFQSTNERDLVRIDAFALHHLLEMLEGFDTELVSGTPANQCGPCHNISRTELLKRGNCPGQRTAFDVHAQQCIGKGKIVIQQAPPSDFSMKSTSLVQITELNARA